MNGELSPGTYRAKNGDLIHCRDDAVGRSQVEVEHHDGSVTWADATAVTGVSPSTGAPFGAVQRTRDSSATPPVGDHSCPSSAPAASQYAQAASWIVRPPFPWRE